MRKLVLFGLLIPAATASAAWSAAPAADTVEKDGVRVTILPTVAAGAAPATTIEAGLDLEAVTDDDARRLGFRSMRVRATFDCRQGANLFSEAVAYDQANLQGQGKVRSVSGKWGQPAPDSVMALVTARVCGGSTATPGPAPTVTAPAAPPAPTPAPAPSSPPTGTVVASPPSAHETPTSPPAAAVPPSRPGPAAKPDLTIVAQVAASPTAKGAQGVLDALRSLVAPPLAGSVEAATVQGAKVYRANVIGFASTAEARAFCAKAAKVARTCWVRRSTAR